MRTIIPDIRIHAQDHKIIFTDPVTLQSVMLKVITAFVFLLAFGSQTFYKAFTVFDYVMNSKSYARNCINKSRPRMHCNGKCQVMKKLQEEEKREAQNAERKMENKHENVLSSLSFFSTLMINPGSVSIQYSILPQKKTSDFTQLIFRPPGT